MGNNSDILEVRDLTKAFGGLTAVDQVSLAFRPNRLQSIIGPNGAGKTTFFNLLSGMFPPSSGRIFYKGEDITALPPPEIFRRRIVRTFQISSIFPELSVYDNVKIAAQGCYRTSNSPWGRLTLQPNEIRNKCMDQLDRLQLSDQWERKAGLLAYGDKRRLEIVMSLVCDPELLLLDEPTAGMSPEETEHTAELLQNLADSITLILVEHDMKVIMGISDHVIVFDRGTVLATGTPEEVQANVEVQACYLGTGLSG